MSQSPHMPEPAKSNPQTLESAAFPQDPSNKVKAFIGSPIRLDVQFHSDRSIFELAKILGHLQELLECQKPLMFNPPTCSLLIQQSSGQVAICWGRNNAIKQLSEFGTDSMQILESGKITSILSSGQPLLSESPDKKFGIEWFIYNSENSQAFNVSLYMVNGVFKPYLGVVGQHSILDYCNLANIPEGNFLWMPADYDTAEHLAFLHLNYGELPVSKISE